MGTPGSSSETEHLLRWAELKTLGRLRSASNVVLLCELESQPEEFLCVYKPVRGERPLWDFPEGSLAGREFASYLISEALGWSLVPPTALRHGPHGWGMAQRWVRAADGSEDELVGFYSLDQVPAGWLAVVLGSDSNGEEVALAHADHPRLRQLAVLDALLNNADRKGGHVLLDEGGGVWGIDHGVCLHEDPKLRTVLWGWAGEPIPPDQLADIGRLAASLDGALGKELSEHLTEDELTALGERAERLLAGRAMPVPDGDRVLPWPLM
ncbi:MAG: SCO1664 family protein [Segniliparus sp.]|uniref:SCO1664 family protein n=1 Tax=Segniliparus sp. TaxID=2804064 RepID=UPI003F3B2505